MPRCLQNSSSAAWSARRMWQSGAWETARRDMSVVLMSRQLYSLAAEVVKHTHEISCYSLLHLGEQADRALDRLTGLGGRSPLQHLGDMAFEHLASYAIHAGTCSQNLGHDLFAGFAFIEHADDAADLPLDAPEPQLNVGLSVAILSVFVIHRRHDIPCSSHWWSTSSKRKSPHAERLRQPETGRDSTSNARRRQPARPGCGGARRRDSPCR